MDIIGVTGTSAGAMNGAVLVDGLVRGGPEQARAQLRRYSDGLWGYHRYYHLPTLPIAQHKLNLVVARHLCWHG